MKLFSTFLQHLKSELTSTLSHTHIFPWNRALKRHYFDNHPERGNEMILCIFTAAQKEVEIINILIFTQRPLGYYKKANTVKAKLWRHNNQRDDTQHSA